jgi:hypothetical protein
MLGHPCPEPRDLAAQRAVGEHHHLQPCIREMVAGPPDRREQDPIGPAHDPDRAQEGDP